MRLRWIIGLLCVMVLAGCQGPPPTVVYIVVTATPNETDIARDATRDAAVTIVARDIEPIWLTATAIYMAQIGQVGTVEFSEPVTASPIPPSATVMPTQSPTTVPPSALPPTLVPATLPPTALPATDIPVTNTLGPTPLPANFPTPVMAQIQVAEQLFEGGRMFWIQPTGQIWLLTITSEGHGKWTIYEDNFADGEPETDPSIVPPDGRYQPERGFGKLWRESPEIRQALGWGVTPEFGYVSRYEYHAGGSVDANGVYTPGPGYHILFSLGGELFRFNEADGTWQLGDN